MTKFILLYLGSYGLALLAGVAFYRLATRGLEAAIRWCRPDPDDLLRFVLWHSPPYVQGVAVAERLRRVLGNRQLTAVMAALFSMLGFSPMLRQWWGVQSHALPLPWGTLHATLAIFVGCASLMFAYGSAVSRIAHNLLLGRFPASSAIRSEPSTGFAEQAAP